MLLVEATLSMGILLPYRAVRVPTSGARRCADDHQHATWRYS